MGNYSNTSINGLVKMINKFYVFQKKRYLCQIKTTLV